MTSAKIIEVAAAVLLRENGAFLLAQRPPGKVYEGYWEFPGGKIEAGETPLDALCRELHEELGITGITAHPWLARVFTYPHATVRLHFFRVFAWQGEPHGHEGQQLSWQRLPLLSVAPGLSVAPLLPANTPILRALELPDWYAISNAAELGCEGFMLRLERALQNGLRLLQVREKNLSGEALAHFAAQAVQLAHRYDAKVLLNGDAELARRVNADGVHFTGAQLHDCRSRPACAWCSVSCHNASELQRAGELGFDCALLSPVLPTRSHPGAAHLGWEKFAEYAASTTLPVYALGGLTAADLPIAQRHGAHGIAMLRQAW
ncbi:MAG: Nudix family hydrolase [Gallionella sp.]|nr:Nudix family hydrolase [Gallionella sp.]